jgi:Rad3-related DNA helicase
MARTTQLDWRSLPPDLKQEFLEKLQARRASIAGKAFKRKYRNDRVAFRHDCVTWNADEKPARYQDEIFATLDERRRAAVRGPHGIGKTAIAALTVLHFALTRDGEDWKCPTTASVWRQLSRYLWPEIHKWSRRLKWEKILCQPFTNNELLSLNLKLTTGEAFAVASSNHELIEGAHADSLFYVFDEAKAIPTAVFDAAAGALSSGGCFAFAISTPEEPQGRYDIHTENQV